MTNTDDGIDELAARHKDDGEWHTTEGDVWCVQPDRYGEPAQVLLATTEPDRAKYIAALHNAQLNRAALHPLPGDGWNSDMDAAPRDGTEIMVWCEDDGCWVVHWRQLPWMDAPGWVTNATGHVRDATHWRPLPPPPEPQREGE